MNRKNACPIAGARHAHSAAAGGARTNRDWWPSMLNLSVLRQHSSLVNPMGEDFNYIQEFKRLDLDAVKKDLHALMTDSQEWWPADYGHYGPFFIRMAWHVAGTYRTGDGRGGSSQGLQRFAPTNSWPDNANLDKARRLLWPIKQKYGRKISWADLFILAGNCAHDSMGFKTFGFGGGREDVWQAAEDIYWGSEEQWLGNDERYQGQADHEERVLEKPLAAVHMGLIYVNPEGPNGQPNPLDAAKDIRETFARMAMNDEETVALIAGGHSFGKCHGAAHDSHVGADPNASSIEEQGFGWKNTYKSGKGTETITSGLEGAWTTHPTAWNQGKSFFDMLFGYQWKLGKSPAGAYQWYPKDQEEEDFSPDAGDPKKKLRTMMLTTDISLIKDPAYREIAKKFHEDPKAFADAYARAWFKLTHRDMGPVIRYLGKDVPKERLLWQDPLPSQQSVDIDAKDIAQLKKEILESELSIADLVTTAWASASTFRSSDKRGGANGARIRLDPQKNWDVNEPKRLAHVLSLLQDIQRQFNKKNAQKHVSVADLIVLGGCAAIEKAAHNARYTINVPFRPGRVDAMDEHTDASSFEPLEPETDGFRNYAKTIYTVPSEALLVDKAQLLTLTAPEMTVLVGGLRVLGANHMNRPHGVLTDKPETLTNDFFVNLLDMAVEWLPTDASKQEFEGKHRKTGRAMWKATRVDLIFGHHAELRALAEVYGCQDGAQKFIDDFVAAWVKVMELDRFDLDPNYA
ncbi:MAG: catalase/peroxidase HPI [Alphaproteobacteria bacterium GM7ARS4]|nr:catalase/peroxidase HPI [Alphaproteobacteria bacterium GM7ARS4]